MSEIQLFEFLKNSLSLTVSEENREFSDGAGYRNIMVKLYIKNPSDGSNFELSNESFSIPD